MSAGCKLSIDTLVNVTGDDDFPIADAGADQTVNENSDSYLRWIGFS